MKPAALLLRMRTKRRNVKFSDFIALVKALGFEFDRQTGSHALYRHSYGAVLNLQNDDGDAKPYQIAQLLSAVDSYGLNLR
jgi:hypothetical protein